MLAPILIADSKQERRAHLKAVVLSLGYNVLEADDGFEVLRVLEKQPVSVLLFDAQLAGIDGLTIARRLKASATTGAIALLLLADPEDPELWQEALDAGVDELLPRPVAAELLHWRVQRLLRDRGGSDLLVERAAHRKTRRWLEKASERLRASQEERESLARLVAHDLRSPLRGIKNLADMVIDDLGPRLPAEPAANLRMLIEQALKLEALLDGLLEYSSVGGPCRRVGAVDLNWFFDDLRARVQLPDGFELRLPRGLPTIQTSLDPLRKVLLSLIHNSVAHHDAPPGRIHVKARSCGESRLEFAVIDDGPGIPRERQTEAFELFRSLGKSGSTGMGLAYVKKVVESMGGQIRIESPGQRGLRVIFNWPMDWEATSDAELDRVL